MKSLPVLTLLFCAAALASDCTKDTAASANKCETVKCSRDSECSRNNCEDGYCLSWKGRPLECTNVCLHERGG